LDLTEILDRAREHPEAALVELFLGLAPDVFTLQEEAHAAASGGFEARVGAWGEAIEGGDVPSLHRGATLALLVALDRAVHAGTVGEQRAPRRFGTPPGDGWLVPRPAGWRPSRQLNHLAHWLECHWIVPAKVVGFDVRIDQDAGLLRALAPVGAGGVLRIWTGGFDDNVHPEWIEPPPYRCTELENPEARWASIEALLDAAAAVGAHIVLLPELTATPALRVRVQDRLAGASHPHVLVVPGSFHEVEGDRPVNLAIAADAQGREVLVHRKLLAMRTEAIVEHVRPGAEVRLLVTPFGLLGLAICLDFCEGIGPGGQIWSAIGPGLVLVPSMGKESTYNAHRAKAHRMWLEHGTVTAVASQPESWPVAPLYGLVHDAHGVSHKVAGGIRGPFHGEHVDVHLGAPGPRLV
jgi:hypothetical protein